MTNPRDIDRPVRFLAGLDHPGAVGLEIGALDKPCVPQPLGMMYHADRQTREQLRAWYHGHPGLNLDAFVHVDFVVEGVDYPKAVGDQRFDYVLASHVGEHIPNFVGWLRNVSAILKPNGVLSLILPDKRFTFDRLHRTTTAAEMLWHYLRNPRRPSFLRIVRCLMWTTEDKADTRWGIVSRARIAHVLQRAGEATRRREYFDIHCSIFTPTSFLSCLETLARLRLIPFRIQSFHDTFPGEIDFMLRLEKHPPQGVEGILASIRRAREKIELRTPDD